MPDLCDRKQDLGGSAFDRNRNKYGNEKPAAQAVDMFKDYSFDLHNHYILISAATHVSARSSDDFLWKQPIIQGCPPLQGKVSIYPPGNIIFWQKQQLAHPYYQRSTEAVRSAYPEAFKL